MGMISISDGVDTWTGYADEVASPLWNANTSITIGGVPRSQADTQRLKIMITAVGKQSEIRALMAVLKNFDATIMYTPSRPLFDKLTADIMTIAIVNTPRPTIRGRSGEILYELEIEAEEIIGD